MADRMDLPPRAAPEPLDPHLAAVATRVLAAPPRPPRDPGLFTSGTLFGEPGTYPQGPPMAPADGPDLDDDGARNALGALLPDLLGRTAVRAALDLYGRSELRRAAPPPLLRAGLVVLAGTLAAPALDGLLAADTPVVGPFDVEAMPGSGRVLGPGAAGAPTRALNDRYRAEHPAVVAPSLAHDLLWSGAGDDQYEEATLHAVLAMVHLQVVARCPAVAHLGTELTRRQNSLAITLANSRHPGSAAISVRADDGRGTIPGGAPELQTRDFWSIPFAGGGGSGRAAPAALGRVLAAVASPGAAVPSPLRYDEALAAFLAVELGRGWLDVGEQLRAAVALGLVEPDDVAAAAGLGPDEAVDAFGLAAACACWTA